LLSINDECQFQLHLAELLTTAIDFINLIAVRYAGLLRRSVCLFLLHLCAVWHGGGQKVSLTSAYLAAAVVVKAVLKSHLCVHAGM